MPVNVKAGQHTVYWGDSLLLGGAVHGVSYAQNSLDVWKAFATPGAEAKELFRPRGGLTLQAQPTKDLSIAGQWFYNWQAVRVPESGSYLTINDGLQFGGDSPIVGANPFAAAIPGAPAFLRALEHEPDPAVALQRQPRRLGPLRALEPGVARRHAGLLRPQRDRHPAAAVPDAGRRDRRPGGDLHGDRRHRRGARRLHRQQERHDRRRPDEVRQVGTYSLAYGNDIHIFGVSLSKNIGGVSRRCGAVLPRRTCR